MRCLQHIAAYFYECVGNKALKDIDRSDVLNFATFLRDEKDQAPRSAYNNFKNVITFLNRHGINSKSLKLTCGWFGRS